MGFIDDHKDVMKVVEKVVGDMVAACTDEREGGEGREQVKRPLLVHPIPQISFWKARILAGETGRTKSTSICRHRMSVSWVEWARREFQSDFLFVTGYPLEKRPS